MKKIPFSSKRMQIIMNKHVQCMLHSAMGQMSITIYSFSVCVCVCVWGGGGGGLDRGLLIHTVATGWASHPKPDMVEYQAIECQKIGNCELASNHSKEYHTGDTT